MNLLYYDDNLDVLSHHVEDESVDLVCAARPPDQHNVQAGTEGGWQGRHDEPAVFRLV